MMIARRRLHAAPGLRRRSQAQPLRQRCRPSLLEASSAGDGRKRERGRSSCRGGARLKASSEKGERATSEKVFATSTRTISSLRFSFLLRRKRKKLGRRKDHSFLFQKQSELCVPFSLHRQFRSPLSLCQPNDNAARHVLARGGVAARSSGCSPGFFELCCCSNRSRQRRRRSPFAFASVISPLSRRRLGHARRQRQRRRREEGRRQLRAS